MKLPRIGITMGDPAGVGPEVVMKALADPSIQGMARPVVIGDAKRLEKAAKIIGTRIKTKDFDCIDLAGVAPVPEDLPFGQTSAVAGEASFRYIERAVKLTVDGTLDAMCTGPISKEAINAAGHKYPGHTEMLAEMTGTKEVSLMLFSPKLRVIHVTAHMGLLDAIASIDAGLVGRTISRGRELMARAGDADPRIGICGINPHAGEAGLFGRGEEEIKIVPAVAEARARGWKVEGPLPADSLFYLAARGDYDLVVAMYHDQGHGPVKALGMEHGVNVTAGLPIVRTSVDHGTAFDIAGTGKADARSMLESIRLAALLSRG
jgi:4-phospho-D-threonate 3-dehydrogenase / 4-phospho-D-erythronate 3-dehydrogenase